MSICTLRKPRTTPAPRVPVRPSAGPMEQSITRHGRRTTWRTIQSGLRSFIAM